MFFNFGYKFKEVRRFRWFYFSILLSLFSLNKALKKLAWQCKNLQNRFNYIVQIIFPIVTKKIIFHTKFQSEHQLLSIKITAQIKCNCIHKFWMTILKNSFSSSVLLGLLIFKTVTCNLVPHIISVRKIQQKYGNKVR